MFQSHGEYDIEWDGIGTSWNYVYGWLDNVINYVRKVGHSGRMKGKVQILLELGQI